MSNPKSDARHLLADASTAYLQPPKPFEITVELTKDHRSIAHDLKLLQATAKGTKSDRGPSEAAIFNRMTHSLHEHFRKEERLLFPLLRSSLGFNVCNRFRRDQLEILRIIKIGKRARHESFTRLERLMRAHISTEENVLFWYIELQGRRADRPAGKDG